MQRRFSSQLRPLRVRLPSIEKNSKVHGGSLNSLDVQRSIYGKAKLSSIKKEKKSTSSESSDSKETQLTSERCLTGEGSLNDISTFNPPLSRRSQEETIYHSRDSIDSKRAQKVSFGKGLYEDISSLQDISTIEEPVHKIQLPSITAKCWAIMDGKTGELLFSKKETRRREIASLTKMMNLLCVCKLLEEFKIDPKLTYFDVSEHAATRRGTSAFLKAGDILSIWDLLHGLMLPSGNDAATVLAENFGSYIYINSDEYKAKCDKNPDYAKQKIFNPIKYFIRFMNETAKSLGLKHTYYANAHGLVNANNLSTAADQAKLTFHLMKIEMVRDIVNTKVYTCEVINESESKNRKLTWENTNKLLGVEGWSGVKTGITTAAGPCLSAYYENHRESYIVILLSSISMESRWLEAPKLVDWAIQNRDRVKAE